jgi:hypothetical protein
VTDCTRTLAEYNNGLARPGCPGSRFGFARALISNLRMNPCEPGLEQGVGAVDLMARHIWLLVPVQQKIREFFADHDKVPHQEGNSLSAGGIGYGLIRQAEAMKRLKGWKRLTPKEDGSAPGPRIVARCQGDVPLV